MKQFKLAMLAIGVVLAVLIVVQNTQQVELRVLYLASITMPLVLMLVLTLVAGFFMGWLATSLMGRRPTPPQPPVTTKA